MKKTFIILFTSIICLFVGVIVVYYNTASLGYDNAVIISVNENEIRIMDFVVNYEDVKNKSERIAEKFDMDFITI